MHKVLVRTMRGPFINQLAIAIHAVFPGTTSGLASQRVLSTALGLLHNGDRRPGPEGPFPHPAPSTATRFTNPLETAIRGVFRNTVPAENASGDFVTPCRAPMCHRCSPR